VKGIYRDLRNGDKFNNIESDECIKIGCMNSNGKEVVDNISEVIRL
jgi:hypothetical protein